MEWVVRLSWGMLALVHLLPAAVLVQPELIRRLYGEAPGGSVGVLLWHRGALFAAILLVCLFAILDPAARRAASLVTAVSVVGFLLIYLKSGMPEALRSIAVGDIVALVPLLIVLWQAWRPQAA